MTIDTFANFYDDEQIVEVCCIYSYFGTTDDDDNATFILHAWTVDFFTWIFYTL